MTNATHFSPTEAIAYGWDATKRNVSVLLPLAVLQLVLSTIESSFAGMRSDAGGLGHLLAQAAQVALAIGWWRVALRLHDGVPVSLGALREVSLDEYLQYLVVIVAYALMVVVGLVLLIVPGLYLGARYALAPILVVDEKLDAIGALRRSAELTRGSIVELVVLGLLLVLLNFVGALALGVGLVVTIPISVMAAVRVHRRLREAAAVRESAPSHAPPSPPRLSAAPVSP